MSIKVTIEQHPDAAFTRVLLISRVSDLGLVESPDGPDLADHEFIYEVESRRPRRRAPRRTMFSHRYGDPLTTLVAKAITALDEAGLTEQPRVARVAA